jgi:hypothetical protein
MDKPNLPTKNKNSLHFFNKQLLVKQYANWKNDVEVDKPEQSAFTRKNLTKKLAELLEGR